MYNINNILLEGNGFLVALCKMERPEPCNNPNKMSKCLILPFPTNWNWPRGKEQYNASQPIILPVQKNSMIEAIWDIQQDQESCTFAFPLLHHFPFNWRKEKKMLVDFPYYNDSFRVWSCSIYYTMPWLWNKYWIKTR